MTAGRAFHNEGAAPSDELAYMLAALTENLRILKPTGFFPEKPCPALP